ncbi:MAG: hypothetical protein R3B70_27975 [Polyangiaceae bacterium]
MSVLRRASWLFPMFPLAIGMLVMLQGGAPPARWAVQLGAGALGAILFLASGMQTQRSPRETSAPVLAIGVAAILASMMATLTGDGLSGVHRWIALGPILLHPSALFSPLLLAVASRQIIRRPPATLVVLAATQALHLAQPDAGQATSFGVAVAVLILGTRALASPLSRGFALALTAASIAVAWLRPDPLAPAPFVEDILARAAAQSPAIGGLAAYSLFFLVITPQLAPATSLGAHAGARRGPGVAPGAMALTAYLACSVLVVLAGQFPVPVLGFGASPVLGVYLGLAALGARPAR